MASEMGSWSKRQHSAQMEEKRKVSHIYVSLTISNSTAAMVLRTGETEEDMVLGMMEMTSLRVTSLLYFESPVCSLTLIQFREDSQF